MSWEQGLIALVAVETAALGWFQQRLYDRITKELDEHRADIVRLYRGRSRDRQTLAEICASLPQMKLFMENDDDD